MYSSFAAAFGDFCGGGCREGGRFFRSRWFFRAQVGWVTFCEKWAGGVTPSSLYTTVTPSVFRSTTMHYSRGTGKVSLIISDALCWMRDKKKDP